MLARGESDRSLTGAWGRVQPPMEAFPPPNGRSSSKESKSGAIFLNRSWEAPVLSFERCGGTRRVNIVAGTFSGAWRRVVSPMEVFPPYNNRSGDDLSVGGGLGLNRATIYPMVEVVARLDAWKLEFRGSPCLTELGSLEKAPVHAIIPGKCGSHRRRQCRRFLNLLKRPPQDWDIVTT
uniref:Uncharacterized protein n=1 Tax=Fagus sylvatica TaxID=28930 RepID=A0A2N9ECD0_FAGSY